MALRATIRVLESSVARKQDEVRQLEQQNEQLRARLLGLALAWRVLAELRAHRRAFGEDCGEEDAAAWQAHLDSFGAGAGEALALLGMACSEGSSGGGGGGSSGGGGECSGSSACGSTGSCGGADPLCRARLPGLQHLHMPDRSLLHLDGATEEAVEAMKGQTVAGVKELWRATIREACGVRGPGKPCGAAERRRAAGIACDADAARAADAALYAAGVLMQRTMSLMSIWAPDSYLAALATNIETGEVVRGLRDAPLSHWEAVVAAAGLTRAQALLYVTTFRPYRARLAALHEERARLLARLSAATESAGAAGPAMGMALRAASVEAQDGLVEELSRTSAAERGLMRSVNLIGTALLAPRQFARLMLAAYPYPVHAPCVCEVLEHKLKFEPEFFSATSTLD